MGGVLNTVLMRPVLRQRCQFWLFLYSSSKLIVMSAAEFRDELSAMVQKPRGQGCGVAVNGDHRSQPGGLITKMTATDSGDQMWRVFSDKPLGLNLSEENSAEIADSRFAAPVCPAHGVYRHRIGAAMRMETSSAGWADGW
jgi:hypothetical protein